MHIQRCPSQHGLLPRCACRLLATRPQLCTCSAARRRWPTGLSPRAPLRRYAWAELAFAACFYALFARRTTPD